MVKHILGQAFFQAIILFVFVFGGRYFLPDECDPYTGYLSLTHPIAEIRDNAPDFDSNGLTPVDGWEKGITYMEVYDITAKEAKKRMDNCPKYVLDGSVQSIGGDDMYRHYETSSPSRHLSFVFNLFVFLQIFNMLGARKINDEKNIFEGIFKNPMFLGVWFTIFFGQILIIIFGKRGMGVHV
jgi:Ca2+ transporting ATPase